MNAKVGGTIADVEQTRPRHVIRLLSAMNGVFLTTILHRLVACAVSLGVAVCGVGCETVAEPPVPARAEAGRIVFAKYCAACHHAEGLGTPQGPPMVDSPWVAGSESRLIRIVLHGLRGPIEVGTTSFSLEMPGLGMTFKDEDIAAVLTYVRWRWGDPSDPVSPEMVSQIRSQHSNRLDYWTVAELETME